MNTFWISAMAAVASLGKTPKETAELIEFAKGL